MLIKILTLKFSPDLEGFADDLLQGFCANHRVFEAKEELFVHNGAPYWSVVVHYDPVQEADDRGSSQQGKKNDWRDLLSEEQMPCFEALRAWRNDRAREQGISAYIIGTNRMLADIVRRRPTSLEELKDVPGFGPAKLKDYGKDILGLLNTSPSVSRETANQQDGNQ